MIEDHIFIAVWYLTLFVVLAYKIGALLVDPVVVSAAVSRPITDEVDAL